MDQKYKELKLKLLEIKNRKKSLYDDYTCAKVRIVYLLAIFVWIVIVSMLNIKVESWGWFFFAIPIIVFLINIFGISGMKTDDEDIVLQSDFLPFAFLSVIILTNWKSKKNVDGNFFKILVLSIILLVLSAANFSVGEGAFSVLVHVKVIFQTMAMALIVWNLYLFYLKSDNEFTRRNHTNNGDRWRERRRRKKILEMDLETESETEPSFEFDI